MPPIRSAAFDRLRKPYERPASSTVKGRSDGKWLHDRGPGAEAGGPSNRLQIANLHWEVSENDLANIFSTIGTLASPPHIKFDRSGRSTGVAFIEYSTSAEAIRAKNQLDGKVAKTQAMAVTFATPRVPQAVKAAARGGGGGANSLLDRVSKPPLLSRISGSEGSSKSTAPTGSGRGRSRTRGRGGARGGGGPRAPRGERKKEPTAKDLDKELETFMANPGSVKENVSNTNAGDIEMS